MLYRILDIKIFLFSFLSFSHEEGRPYGEVTGAPLTRRDRSNGKAACNANVNDCDRRKGNMNFLEFQRSPEQQQIYGGPPRCLNLLNKNTKTERDCPNDASVSEVHLQM